MEQSKMEDFVTNAALLAAHLTDQCNRAANAQEASAQELKSSALDVRKAFEEGTREMGDHARRAMREALAQEVPAATQSIDETVSRLRQAIEKLDHEQSTFARRTRFLGAQSVGALGAACVLMVAGTGYVAWHNVKRSEQAKVDAEVLEALQHVTITSCGGQPCIRLQDGLPRWQKNDQYVLIDTSARQEGKTAGGR